MPGPSSLHTQPLAGPEFFADIELHTYATNTENLTQARVVIIDEGGEPVSGVGVYGFFTTGVQIDVQSYTDEHGVAYFEFSAADDSVVGFQIDLVSYEIDGDRVYVEVSGAQAGDPILDPSFVVDDTVDGIAEGMGTSTGVTTEDPAPDGSSSRTSEPCQGMGTSTGVTADSTTDMPSDSGMGTSTGVTPKD
jgi:hypothetical protein